MSKTIVIMAGGTGGHIFPGLAVADEFQQRGYEIIWFGTVAGMESTLVKEANIPLEILPIQGVRGKGFLSILAAPINIGKSIAMSVGFLRRVNPVLVIGMGGFVAGPGGIAAKLRGIPLVIHEQNAIPGTTNKILSKFATQVMTAFPHVFKRAEVVGNPLRSKFESLLPYPERIAARKDKGPINILVCGGSRGAKAINELLPKVFLTLSKIKKIRIWHQCGKHHASETQKAYEAADFSHQVSPFINDMNEAYAWADFVICRSGALTVSELSVAGLPSILIPFPFAIDDHQTANGEFLVKAGAAVLLQQSSLTAEKLVKVVGDLIDDGEKRLAMAKCAKSLAASGAAKQFVDLCEVLIRDK